MIERANADAAALVAEAAQDALFIRAGAEPNSLRLTGTARQDADAEMKGARSEAERMIREAEQESSRLMEEGRLATEAAAEEVRVLDQQRIELLVDVEAMQRTFDQMDIQLEARLNPTPVVEDQPPAGWTPEPAVRVVPASRVLTPGPIDADELMAEVARLREESAVATPGAGAPPDDADGETPAAGEDDAEDEATDPPVEEAYPSPEAAGPVEVSVGAEVIELARRGGEVIELPVPSEASVEPAGAPVEPAGPLEPAAVSEAAGPRSSALDDLFASLRISGEETAVDVGESDGDLTAESDSEQVPAQIAEPAPPPAGDSPPAVDPATAAELRARLLLPTENTALRTVKRGMIDLQNRVLAEIHDDPTGWSPDRAATGEAFAASMATLVEAAFAAGHEAAGELTGRPGPEPATGTAPLPDVDLGAELAAQLADAQRRAVAVEAGPKEIAAVVSKVFRAWRMDEGERRLHAVSWSAYHHGVLSGLAMLGVDEVTTVADARGCADCSGRAPAPWDPAGPAPAGWTMPPAHSGCVVSIVPA